MAKPETPAEEKFLKLLDDYCNLLPEQDHIGCGDEETLRRALVWYSTDELFAATVGLIKVLMTLSEVITAAGRGEMRQSWGYCLKDVAKEMTRFGHVIHEAHDLRYN